MVSEVADHQDILRSLSKTLLVKNLVKKSVRQIEKDRRRHAAEIQDELNLQVSFLHKYRAILLNFESVHRLGSGA